MGAHRGSIHSRSAAHSALELHAPCGYLCRIAGNHGVHEVDDDATVLDRPRFIGLDDGRRVHRDPTFFAAHPEQQRMCRSSVEALTQCGHPPGDQLHLHTSQCPGRESCIHRALTRHILGMGQRMQDPHLVRN